MMINETNYLNYITKITNIDKNIIKSSYLIKTFNNSTYDFTIILYDNKTIQIDIFDNEHLLNYHDILTDNFITKYHYIKTIALLYNIIIDSLQETHTNICEIFINTKNKQCIQFTITYNLHYDSSNIQLSIEYSNLNHYYISKK